MAKGKMPAFMMKKKGGKMGMTPAMGAMGGAMMPPMMKKKAGMRMMKGMKGMKKK